MKFQSFHHSDFAGDDPSYFYLAYSTIILYYTVRVIPNITNMHHRAGFEPNMHNAVYSVCLVIVEDRSHHC